MRASGGQVVHRAVPRIARVLIDRDRAAGQIDVRRAGGEQVHVDANRRASRRDSPGTDGMKRVMLPGQQATPNHSCRACWPFDSSGFG